MDLGGGEIAISSSTRMDGVMPYAIDPATARLWTLSETMIGLDR